MDDSIKNVLDYNPNTGKFTYRISPHNHMKKGDEAGANIKGYIGIIFKRKRYYAHRLA